MHKATHANIHEEKEGKETKNKNQKPNKKKTKKKERYRYKIAKWGLIIKGIGWERINEKTNSKDNIAPKIFLELAYEKAVKGQLSKGVYFFSLPLHFALECHSKMSDK